MQEQTFDINKAAALKELLEDLCNDRNLAAVPSPIREKILEARNMYEGIMDNFIASFEAIKKQNLEMDEMIRLLSDRIDELSNNITDGDRDFYTAICRQEYSSFWDKLDQLSKEFLVTAAYIFGQLRRYNGDFSPYVIELTRIFENELKQRIFIDYIQSLASAVPTVTDSRVTAPGYQYKVFMKIKRAFNRQRNGQPYFLSASDMLDALKNLSVSGNYGYMQSLYDLLVTNGGNVQDLSDTQYLNRAQTYIVTYRNEAAHPNIMAEHMAESCNTETKDIVGRFEACFN